MNNLFVIRIISSIITESQIIKDLKLRKQNLVKLDILSETFSWGRKIPEQKLTLDSIKNGFAFIYTISDRDLRKPLKLV